LWARGARNGKRLGTVNDNQAAVLAIAPVEGHKHATNVTNHTQRTSPAGEFHGSYLPPGTYFALRSIIQAFTKSVTDKVGVGRREQAH